MRMHFDFTVVELHKYDFDPEDFRGMKWSEIVTALRAELPPGTDPLDVQNAAAEISSWLGAGVES